MRLGKQTIIKGSLTYQTVMLLHTSEHLAWLLLHLLAFTDTYYDLLSIKCLMLFILFKIVLFIIFQVQKYGIFNHISLVIKIDIVCLTITYDNGIKAKDLDYNSN